MSISFSSTKKSFSSTKWQPQIHIQYLLLNIIRLILNWSFGESWQVHELKIRIVWRIDVDTYFYATYTFRSTSDDLGAAFNFFTNFGKIRHLIRLLQTIIIFFSKNSILLTSFFSLMQTNIRRAPFRN